MQVKRNITISILITVTACLGMLPAMAEDKPPVITQPWVMFEKGNPMQLAVYMDIHNPGESAVHLVRAESNSARMVMLQRATEQDGKLYRMMASSIGIPEQGTLKMSSRGYRLALVGVKKNLVVGDRVTIKLYFKKQPVQTIVFPVRSIPPSSTR